MTFSEYLLHQLREMKREVLTSIEDVPEEDLFSFEPLDHWPIGWIVEHCTEVADKFLWVPVKGSSFHSYAEQVGNWPSREPVPDDNYPSPPEIAQRWSVLCDSVVELVESLSEEEIQRDYGREPYINSILRVINHTNSHLRSLWCLLGQRRVDHKWAEQQSFLA